MALTTIQREVCRLIAERILSPHAVGPRQRVSVLPLVRHDELGLVLHPFDLATNKALALIGRLEVRDCSISIREPSGERFRVSSRSGELAARVAAKAKTASGNVTRSPLREIYLF